MKQYRLITAGFGLLFAIGCTTSRHPFYHETEKGWQNRALPPDSLLKKTLFLTGGVGEGDFKVKNQVLQSLGKQLLAAGENSAVAFLGDNVPKTDLDNETRAAKTAVRFEAHLKILEGYEGEVFFLPGETEASSSELLRWQEEFIEEHLQEQEIFFPSNGCGEPEWVKWGSDIVLILVNSQWWLQGGGAVEGCEIKDRFAFLQRLEEILKKYDKERVVVLMHHPLFSNGVHGGNFSLAHHLFPFSASGKKNYLPLPIIGSLFLLARELGALPQDLPHPDYLLFKQEVLKLFDKNPVNQSVIIAGAHDQNLQYFNKPDGRVHFLVSGSAGDASFARRGKSAGFVFARKGFSKLLFYENSEVWVEFWTLERGGESKLSFRKQLFPANMGTPATLPSEFAEQPLPGSVTTVASNQYRGGLFWKTMFGATYHQAWKTPVEAAVLNFNEEFAGWKILQQGGGMSSKNLRLLNPNGHEYVLRSVDKEVRRGLPKELQRTVVEGFIQNLKSNSHPYGALVVSRLAEAARVYHAHPKLFFLPKQTALGNYNDRFGGELYLLEERPDDDWSDLASFGNSSNIIGFTKLLEKIYGSPNHRVDEQWALKSRLFDQWIGDYDRHDDQWRWATFPKKDGTTLYRPVPRDRDAAFADLRGLVPFVSSRRWLYLQQRAFREKIYDVPGQAKPAKNFDRSYLTSLDLDDWRAAANDLKNSLPDSLVEKAFNVLPPEIHQLDAPKIIKKLKSRRDNIHLHAEKLYRFLARYVDVVGTDKRELFQVNRLENGDVEVAVFAMNKAGEKQGEFYRRLFKKKETKEVRLYGLDGEDVFHLIGKVKKSILVRIVGGRGSDEVKDDSQAQGGRRTVVYDQPDGVGLQGNEIKNATADDLKINEHNRYEFKYNTYFPLVKFGRTIDDGVFLGGGLSLTYYQFRKEPYGTKHSLNGQFSTRTDAFGVHWESDFTKAVGNLSFHPSISFDRPVIRNFYGYGNDSKLPVVDTNHFNWVRLEKFSIQPLLKRRWYNQRNFTRFGPFFERVEVENRPGRITDSGIFQPEALASKNFLGFMVRHDYQALDNTAVPNYGIRWHLGGAIYRNIGEGLFYARLEGSFTSFTTFKAGLEITLGTRIGGARLSNNHFPFYHANDLGGNNYLRGFRNNRFTGRSVFYHNTDLRVKLVYVRNPVAHFMMGLLCGFDYGRVWYEEKAEDEAKAMHTSVSPGVWFSVFNFAAVSGFYSFTNLREIDSYTVRVGFFF